MTQDSLSPSSLYSAFDVFPAPKGAATHIKHMASTLFNDTGSGCLYTLGGEGLSNYQRQDSMELIRFNQKVPNLLQRAIAYGDQLSTVLEQRSASLKICHFRDPWGGLPILSHRASTNANYKTVYEVNALPSIELPYAFPHISPSTLAKIAAQEMLCLEHCDTIITPSHATANMLVNKGIAREKITVVVNGADINQPQPKPIEAPAQYLIYFGAIQQWQGIEDLLRAFSLLADFEQLKLVMCVSKHNRIAKKYRKMADKLGISDRIIWNFGLTQEQLVPWVQHATISLASLTDCSRNREQGCCPLKILESMAAAVPVVASDLPVVRELIADNVHGKLVRADRHHEFSLAVRCLLEEPEVAVEMGRKGQQHLAENFTWQQSCQTLSGVYQKLLTEQVAVTS